jgi:hypothetical protein
MNRVEGRQTSRGKALQKLIRMEAGRGRAPQEYNSMEACRQGEKTGG